MTVAVAGAGLSAEQLADLYNLEGDGDHQQPTYVQFGIR